MKAKISFGIILILLAILFVGCIQPTEQTMEGTNSGENKDIPDLQSTEITSRLPEFTILYNLEVYKNKINFKQQDYFDGEWQDSEYSLDFDADCFDDICLMTFFTPASSADRIRLLINPVDVNILNDTEYIFTGSKNITIITGSQPKQVCNFVYPATQDMDLSRFKTNFEEICQDFNKIEEITGLPLSRKYYLFVAYKTGVGGMYLGNDVILLDSINRPEFNKTILHQLTHASTEKAWMPVWFDEGIAEYTEATISETRIDYRREIEGIENWDPKTPQDVRDRGLAYEYARWIVKKLIDKYDLDKFKKLLKSLIVEKDSSNENLIRKMQETVDANITMELLTHPK